MASTSTARSERVIVEYAAEPEASLKGVVTLTESSPLLKDFTLRNNRASAMGCWQSVPAHRSGRQHRGQRGLRRAYVVPALGTDVVDFAGVKVLRNTYDGVYIGQQGIVRVRGEPDRDNMMNGVNVSTQDFLLLDSEVSGNGRVGVKCNVVTTRIRQSTIRNNGGVGVYLASSGEVVDNLVVGNLGAAFKSARATVCRVKSPGIVSATTVE
jgi:hypothetical protein